MKTATFTQDGHYESCMLELMITDAIYFGDVRISAQQAERAVQSGNYTLRSVRHSTDFMETEVVERPPVFFTE